MCCSHLRKVFIVCQRLHYRSLLNYSCSCGSKSYFWKCLRTHHSENARVVAVFRGSELGDTTGFPWGHTWKSHKDPWVFDGPVDSTDLIDSEPLRPSKAICCNEVIRITCPFTQRCSGITPRKINMEPNNHPIEKENHLPNHHFQVPC